MLPNIVDKQLDAEQEKFLTEALRNVFDEIDLPNKIAQTIEKEVFERYLEPHRTYHNLTHIYSLFKILEHAEDRPKDVKIFSLAIIFHDIIYTIGAHDNESRSAFTAGEKLKGHLSENELVCLGQMIESTVEHKPVSDYVDIPLFLDFDLSILAAPVHVYNKYAKAIRKEYGQFSDEMYREGRRRVLQHFLQQERIFLTDYFFEKYESHARQNLNSELKSLASLFS
ncbi:MAG: hypothetical protein AAFZ15_31440 [Bacteroidota bacterium]